ncbi:Hypothetical protein D9617_69g078010 [Elsinoe fawcettii]|nr:Hypothetical protein D9617_69g078010 [Elsinoe fawcettii]
MIVRFVADVDLRSILPSGTITWQHQGRQQSSTPDVILAYDRIAHRLEKCDVYPTDHGSHHWAITITVAEEDEQDGATLPKGKLLFDSADWGGISRALKMRLPQRPDATMVDTLEQVASRLCEKVSQEVTRAVPRSRPSPHTKRWWSRDLTILRQSMTAARNRVTTVRRRGESTEQAQHDHKLARQLYFQEMDRQKKKHWREFLEDPSNVWKANQYTKLTNTTMQIPTLRKGTQKADTEEGKAAMFMETFFPEPLQPIPHARDTRQWLQKQRLLKGETPPTTTAPISLWEIREAIATSNPKKAAGTDKLSFAVWQHVLDVTIEWIRWLYQASLDLGHIPGEWRMAKIVVIRKPGKSDYTVPKAFRPISLLSTLSKGLEAIVAKRLSYLAERYDLLPSGHFGGRPQRSCEDAVNKLVLAIYDAWRVRRDSLSSRLMYKGH